jgi:histidine phosphotransferase ChpT
MPDIDARLATLVGSRLCHDIISPVGAIQNGLELLALAGDGDTSAELALIDESCASAAARIRFFRVAFGSAGSTQMMGARDCTATLEGFAAGGRVTAVWDVTGDRPRAEVQLAYLAYLCAETALPQGGTVRVACDGDGWSVAADGARIAADAQSWDRLVRPGPVETSTPDRVQFDLLRVLASGAGRRLDREAEAGAARIVIR